MTQYVIDGGRPLIGTVLTGGSKNALLPILAATILYGGPCEIHRAPHLKDVDSLLDTLRYLGAHTHFCGDVITVDTSSLNRYDIPTEYMSRCRASISFLAPLLHRFGRCSLAYPGGCAIGARPINYHLDVLRALGNFRIIEHSQGVEVQGTFTGGSCIMPYPSVGATECALMGACFAPMPCRIEGGAVEPEVEDLAGFLRACGGHVAQENGIWESIPVHFTTHTENLCYAVIPDRIEAGTFALAVAATRGEARILGCNPAHMKGIVRLLAATGAEVTPLQGGLYVRGRNRRLRGCDLVMAYPYPAFPTDLQAPACAFLATCYGKSAVLDTVFPTRYAHVPELGKMGAKISVLQAPGGERYVSIQGSPIRGGRGVSTDLRAGAALLLAGLCGKGRSVVQDPGYIARGYEAVCEKFRGLGGRIWENKLY